MAKSHPQNNSAKRERPYPYNIGRETLCRFFYAVRSLIDTAVSGIFLTEGLICGMIKTGKIRREGEKWKVSKGGGSVAEGK